MIPQEREKREICLALHNIRSTHNVGAIFRTADAAGVSKIYLCGITPAPIDRFGRARSDIAKAALGAEMTVKWESVKDIKKLIAKLKKAKWKIIAVEQSENSINYKKIKTSSKTLFIFGAEVEGIEKEILNMCDQIAEIPMKGRKESLNVSVAAGVILYQHLVY
jgi:tRNA G18 (ribose-2'-O)-methylase SpoU